MKIIRRPELVSPGTLSERGPRDQERRRGGTRRGGEERRDQERRDQERRDQERRDQEEV